MKTSIINNLITNLDRYATIDAALQTSFENALADCGIKVNRKNETAKGTKAQIESFNETMQAALLKAFNNNIREGKGKTAANKLSSLRAKYGLTFGNANNKGSKYSKAQLNKTAKWLKASFNLDDAELRGFVMALYRSLA